MKQPEKLKPGEAVPGFVQPEKLLEVGVMDNPTPTLTTPPAFGQVNLAEITKIPPKNGGVDPIDFNDADQQRTTGGRRGFQQDHDLTGAAQAAFERGWRYGDE